MPLNYIYREYRHVPPYSIEHHQYMLSYFKILIISQPTIVGMSAQVWGVEAKPTLTSSM